MYALPGVPSLRRTKEILSIVLKIAWSLCQNICSSIPHPRKIGIQNPSVRVRHLQRINFSCGCFTSFPPLETQKKQFQGFFRGSSCNSREICDGKRYHEPTCTCTYERALFQIEAMHTPLESQAESKCCIHCAHHDSLKFLTLILLGFNSIFV